MCHLDMSKKKKHFCIQLTKPGLVPSLYLFTGIWWIPARRCCCPERRSLAAVATLPIQTHTSTPPPICAELTSPGLLAGTEGQTHFTHGRVTIKLPPPLWCPTQLAPSMLFINQKGRAQLPELHSQWSSVPVSQSCCSLHTQHNKMWGE